MLDLEIETSRDVIECTFTSTRDNLSSFILRTSRARPLVSLGE